MINDFFVRGQIDRLIKQDNQYVVIDFKYTEGSDETMQSYLFQLKTYALAASKMTNQFVGQTEIHLLKAWRSNEAYYRKKYAGWKRIKSFVEWVKFKALDLIWGNGESAYKLIRAALFILVVISLYDVLMFRDPQDLGSYKQAFFDSPQILLGTLSPEPYSSGSLTVILFMRLVLFGLAVSSTKCKKCSVMLPKIKCVWREQLRRTFEPERFAWTSVQFPRNRIQLFL